MEHLKQTVLEAVESVWPGLGLYERSDTPSRKLEGLEDRSGWLLRECGAEIEIVERDARFAMRLGGGHKTGFYLDQRENRLWMRDAGFQGRAFDVFCYEGAFAVHLARAGLRVTGIDSQADAVRRAEAHRALNGISPDRLDFTTANAFDELKRLEKAGEQADLVVLDPPSFVKKRDAVESAVAGYKELCLRSFKMLRDGGHLALFSCSFHVDENRLMQAALSAARDAGRSLRVVRFFRQSADHPIDPFVPETYYLKGFLFQSAKRGL
jgi:23S rRNA (cytosine1962-C5)-methyltransferase